MSSLDELPPQVQAYVSANAGDDAWRGALPDFLCEVCGYSSWEEIHTSDCRDEYRCLVCNQTGTLTFRDDGKLKDLEGSIVSRTELDGWKCAECGHNDWMVTDRAVPESYDRRYKHHAEGYECLSCGAHAYYVWDARTSHRAGPRHTMHGAVTRANSD